MNKLTDSIKNIFKEDQRDRKMVKAGTLDHKTLHVKNGIRREMIRKIVKNKDKKISGADCFYAAIPFHHSHQKAHLKMALKLAKESVNRGYQRGKKLVMAVEDRICLTRGIPQKYDTQLVLRNRKFVRYKTK